VPGGGTGGNRSEVWPLGTDINGNIARRHISEQHRDKEGRNPSQSAIEERLRSSFERLHTAHAGADQDTNARRITRDVKPGLCNGLAGCGDGEL